MKVAVTATEPSPDGRVDPRFGRCPFFIIIETDDMGFEAIANPNVALGGGAGVQSAQLVAEKGAKFVLTGNCGPNAYQTLSAAGIGVIVGCSGTAAEVVERFKSGQLRSAGEPNVASHFGTGASPGPAGVQPVTAQPDPTSGSGMPMSAGGGRGGGMGRGMGQGGGRGRGMGQGGGRGRGMGQGGGRGGGMGRGMGMQAGPPQASVPPYGPASGPPGGDELTVLRQQAEAMGQQMQQLQERIRQLEQEG
ncbi:MAG: NifB/NifX family molybdenum-iron cluster-binding protein [Phycisphaerae bacterium]